MRKEHQSFGDTSETNQMFILRVNKVYAENVNEAFRQKVLKLKRLEATLIFKSLFSYSFRAGNLSVVLYQNVDFSENNEKKGSG